MKTHSSIPKRLPDGRTNPEYSKAYRQARKEAGKPIKQYPRDAAYWREWRKTEAGKAATKKHNSSEYAKVYQAERSAKRKAATAAKKAAKIANELLALKDE